MFTRSELEVLTVAQLRILCARYGIKPTGNSGYKTSYIVSLMAFPQLALQQLRQDRGLRLPGFTAIQSLIAIANEMNSPTDEQAALIRVTMEGMKMNYPDRYNQEKLLALHTTKMKLEQVIQLLEMQ
ncbi:MAG: hypothetical protein KME21_03345 [Desmonostoc vinosum HA7617-LM4]|jgi:hypothetical protein|nr:hypothetical protein [Desmonostoc vinosum HA7617-LM4]